MYIHGYTGMIGRPIKDKAERLLGTLSDVESDGGIWGTIEPESGNPYQVRLEGSHTIMNLINGEHYLRLP